MVGQPAERLIAKLGPLIRGWANYHRHICAARTFRVVDRIVYQQLRKWARRTHPKKGPGWVKRKYFRLAGPEVFAVNVLRRGERRVMALPRIAKTLIERHIKVRGEANPYDPNYTEYFEKRRCFAWHGALFIRQGRPHRSTHSSCRQTRHHHSSRVSGKGPAS